MAIPTSPSVVVLENDVSIYTPNINSSVVGLVGFANKGPVNKPTLITSQENLIRIFGTPDTNLAGQGLEGALEILEATNQLYFVRGIATADASAYASAIATVGASPAVFVSGYVPSTNTSSIYYAITDNATSTEVTATVNLVQTTEFTTAADIIKNAFNPDVLGNQNVFAHVDGTDIFLASRFAGSGATLQVSAVTHGDADPALRGLSFSALDSEGNASGPGSISQNITTRGFTSNNVGLNLYSIYPGAGYNLSGLRDGSTQGVSVEVNNLSVRDQLAINNDGGQVESFNALELSPSSNDSVEFVLNSTVANNQSEYVFADLETSGEVAYAAPNRFGSKVTATHFGGGRHHEGNIAATPRFVKPIKGTYNFAGGRSGGTSEADLIGTAAKKTGIYALDDDGLNISIGVIPGVTTDEVQNAFITLAESSKNFIALVAPPYGLDEVQDAVNWINGASQDVRAAALNSSYAAVYWPWVQVFNAFAGAEQWYDPSIFAARQYVFTDAVSDPWFAPAGFRRGRLTKPTDTEIKLNQGDKDSLYSNSVNPITNDPTTGITIFGQRTTQRTPTALDRVNVRRLMIYIRKVLLELGKPFQFEPNDQFTWELVEDSINPFLDDLLARRAILEGAVKCDSTTNTPARVDRNELWCSVTIKPTKAAETIVFEVNLTSQSATIN
jgi:phage tail sheath protein FI